MKKYKWNLLSMGYPKLHSIECKIRSYFFYRKLRKVAMFIELHELYPVKLDKDLLEVWKRK